MGGRESWGLRGPVHRCRMERSWFSRRCGAGACEIEERKEVGDVEFRADGAPVRRFHHNHDGSEWTVTYDYDAAGRLTAARTDNLAGSVGLTIYEYDAAGRLARVVARPEGGGDRVLETYEYDPGGRKKKTLHVDVASQRPDTQHIWLGEGSDRMYAAPGAADMTTVYNERGQPAELLFHDAAGRRLSRVAFLYDEAGRLIEEAQSDSVDTLPPELAAELNPAQLETVRALIGAGPNPNRVTHRYDEHGRRVETRSNIGPFANSCRKVQYNDRADPIEQIDEDETREFKIDDEGRLSANPTVEKATQSVARFHYEYDLHGNWLVRTVEGRNRVDEEFTVSSIERRGIDYF